MIPRPTRHFRPAALLFPVFLLLVSLGVVGCDVRMGDGSAEARGGNASGMDIGAGSRTTALAGEPVVVASYVAYPPFEFSPRGGPKGFDIDLMNEVAERVGFEVRYENVIFEELLRGLDFGLYDAAISAITITPGRERRADFSAPYYEASAALVVRDDSGIRSTDGLEDRAVGAQLDTAAYREVERLRGSGRIAKIETFPTAKDAFAALRDGEVDAVIHGLPASSREIENDEETLELVDTIPTGARYGIAFPEDSPLVEPVDEALADIKEDGTYEEIYRKWFDRLPERIP